MARALPDPTSGGLTPGVRPPGSKTVGRAFVYVLALGVASACGSGAVQPPPRPPGEYVAGEILVKYRAGAAAAAVAGSSVRRLVRFRLRSGEFVLALVQVPPGQEAQYVAAYQQRPEVAYADYNFRVRRVPDASSALAPARAGSRPPLLRPQGTLDWTTVPDPKLTECHPAFEVVRLNGEATRCTESDRSASWQWGLWRMRVPQAWQMADGEGVVVAVTDEGVDLQHPEFAGRLVLPQEGCRTDTVDQDHDPADSGGHGTHVAGIVAAGVDGRGTVGVAPQAEVLPVRVLGPLGGTTFTVVTGMLCAAEHGARVINGSWGSLAYSRAEDDAVRTLTASGVVLVFAAGNSYAEGNPRIYPAAFAEAVSGVVAVGASTPTDQVASFSSSGPWVTVAAPGTSVYSTLPTSQGSYGFLQGTSMAAPHVAAVVALLLSRNPDLAPAQVKSVLAATAFSPCPGYPRPDYGGGGSCGAYAPGAGAYGYGVADALAALQAAGTP